MQHIVLLGDSIFDNALYVQRGEPDIIQQLRRKLPKGWKATLKAIDGSMTHDTTEQLQDLPKAATFLVLSVGENEALTRG